MDACVVLRVIEWSVAIVLRVDFVHVHGFGICRIGCRFRLRSCLRAFSVCFIRHIGLILRMGGGSGYFRVKPYLGVILRRILTFLSDNANARLEADARRSDEVSGPVAPASCTLRP